MKPIFDWLDRVLIQPLHHAFDPDELKSFFTVLVARYVRLAMSLITMPALYFFVLVWGLSWLQGFRALPYLATSFDVWLRGIFNGVFLTWTFIFIGFAQRLEHYKLDSWDKTIQGIEEKGNKHWTVYALAVFVWLLTYGLERWLTGGATTWFFLVCAFIQILPLLMGNSLVEQARHLAPKIANWILILTALWLIAVGIAQQ